MIDLQFENFIRGLQVDFPNLMIRRRLFFFEALEAMAGGRFPERLGSSAPDRADHEARGAAENKCVIFSV